MIKTLQNAFKIPDLKKKIVFTLLLLMVVRIGVFIPVPEIDINKFQNQLNSGMLFGFLDLVSGGAFKNFSIFAMGIVPYINSSIIMSLLVIAIPRLETLQKEGEEGRKKIAEYTRYGTIIFAFIQAFSLSIYLKKSQMLVNDSWLSVFIITITLIAGTTFVMWMGEKITEKGLGNGASLIIFVGIIAKFPTIGYSLAVAVKGGTLNIFEVVIFLVFIIASIAGVVAMDLGERRIPVQYAQRRVGIKSYGGQSTHIPINVNSTGVIAIIFAISVMQFPQVITQLTSSPTSYVYQLFNTGILSQKGWIYPIVYIFLIVFFTWFYTSVTFKPDEVAQNLQKNGGFIPGLRPGKPTEDYITKVINRMTVIGGVFASLVAVSPIIISHFKGFSNVYFGGTMLLIIVGVALELKKQVKAQMVMRHYEGFLK